MECSKSFCVIFVHVVFFNEPDGARGPVFTIEFRISACQAIFAQAIIMFLTGKPCLNDRVVNTFPHKFKS